MFAQQFNNMQTMRIVSQWQRPLECALYVMKQIQIEIQYKYKIECDKNLEGDTDWDVEDGRGNISGWIPPDSFSNTPSSHLLFPQHKNTTPSITEIQQQTQAEIQVKIHQTRWRSWVSVLYIRGPTSRWLSEMPTLRLPTSRQFWGRHFQVNPSSEMPTPWNKFLNPHVKPLFWPEPIYWDIILS